MKGGSPGGLALPGSPGRLALPEMARFEDLPKGARFVLPPPVARFLRRGGCYFKTGANSYGTRPDEALWPWLDEAPYVKVL